MSNRYRRKANLCVCCQDDMTMQVNLKKYRTRPRTRLSSFRLLFVSKNGLRIDSILILKTIDDYWFILTSEQFYWRRIHKLIEGLEKSLVNKEQCFENNKGLSISWFQKYATGIRHLSN